MGDIDGDIDGGLNRDIDDINGDIDGRLSDIDGSMGISMGTSMARISLQNITGCQASKDLRPVAVPACAQPSESSAAGHNAPHTIDPRSNGGTSLGSTNRAPLYPQIRTSNRPSFFSDGGFSHIQRNAVEAEEGGVGGAEAQEASDRQNVSFLEVKIAPKNWDRGTTVHPLGQQPNAVSRLVWQEGLEVGLGTANHSHLDQETQTRPFLGGRQAARRQAPARPPAAHQHTVGRKRMKCPCLRPVALRPCGYR